MMNEQIIYLVLDDDEFYDLQYNTIEYFNSLSLYLNEYLSRNLLLDDMSNEFRLTHNGIECVLIKYIDKEFIYTIGVYTLINIKEFNIPDNIEVKEISELNYYLNTYKIKYNLPLCIADIKCNSQNSLCLPNRFVDSILLSYGDSLSSLGSIMCYTLKDSVVPLYEVNRVVGSVECETDVWNEGSDLKVYSKWLSNVKYIKSFRIIVGTSDDDDISSSLFKTELVNLVNGLNGHCDMVSIKIYNTNEQKGYIEKFIYDLNEFEKLLNEFLNQDNNIYLEVF